MHLCHLFPQSEMYSRLRKSLLYDRSNENPQHDETCSELHRDIIQVTCRIFFKNLSLLGEITTIHLFQLTEGLLRTTQTISPLLSNKVQEICFEQILRFMTG